MAGFEALPDILNQRGGRYKRNTLAVSLVALALTHIPGMDISDVSLFNLSLDEDNANYAWGTIVLLLIYNAALFLFELRQSWVSWIETNEQSFVGKVRILFGFKCPSIDHRNIEWIGAELVSLAAQAGRPARFLIRAAKVTEPTNIQTIITGTKRMLNRARFQLVVFGTIDVLLPTVAMLWALASVHGVAFDAGANP